jgi:hypothetical protein
MRKFLVPVIALVFSAAAVTPSLAAPAQRFPIPNVSFQVVNPCTGNTTTVTQSNQILVIHDDVDPNNGQHVSGTITGDTATADGFSGHFATWFGMNLQDITDPIIVGEFADTFSATLRDGSGAVLVVHAIFHVTVPPASGALRGFVEIDSAECRGRPS